MFPLILIVALVGGGLYYVGRRQEARNQTVLGMLSFSPFTLTRGGETVDFLAPPGLQAQVVGQLASKQWKLVPDKTQAQLVQQTVPNPVEIVKGVVTPGAQRWRVVGQYFGEARTITPKGVLDQFVRASTAAPLDAPKALALLLGTESIGTQQAGRGIAAAVEPHLLPIGKARILEL